MIHTMITAINTNLPMLRILLGVVTGLLIAASTFLWLKRGSQSGAIMLLALDMDWEPSPGESSKDRNRLLLIGATWKVSAKHS